MDLPTIVLLIAALLVVVSLAEPFAAQLRLPSTVILAVIGLAIGVGSRVMVGAPDGVVSDVGATIGALPIDSQAFLFIFLPALLFQGGMEIDAREMSEDAVPIFVLAVVAVVVTTWAVGLALAPLSGLPLIAGLIVGAIVATTDPSAVIAIFRDLGAPQRLTRLVEGESLSNDAVAISLFVVFLELVTTGREVSVAPMLVRFVTVPLGGALIGAIAGRIVAGLFSFAADNRLVQVSLTLALPYLAFIIAEHFHLSGPIAVVGAGVVLSGMGPSRASPSSWRYLRDIWDQLAFWAGSLVFILAAILVPRLITEFTLRDVALLTALIVVALLARAAVLFVGLPLLTALKLSPAISRSYRAVILWGGVRGAVTLALALAITENAGVPPDVKRLVAVLATSYVLFTLLVQATTLRPLIRWLGLDRLSAIDRALSDQARGWSHAEARGAIAEAVASYALPEKLGAAIAAEYGAAAEQPEARPDADPIGEREAIALGLTALAGREQDLILEHVENQTLSPALVSRLISRTRRLVDGARLEGLEGYRREAMRGLAFGRDLRLANRLHRRFGISRFLEQGLAARFEALLVNRIVLNPLAAFAGTQLTAMFGEPVGNSARSVLAERNRETVRSLDALSLQYPDYAEALQRRFLFMAALRREREGYDRLYGEGLIGREVRRALLDDVARRAAGASVPRLDIRLDTPTLIRRVPLFKTLSDAEVDDLGRLMRPAFAIPGERLVTKGGHGDAAFFIASGAVEVDAAGGIRLGRGDFFGEMALLTGAPRSADVTAIAFCELLVLYAREFHAFLARHREIRELVERVAEERMGRRRPEGEPGEARARKPG